MGGAACSRTLLTLSWAVSGAVGPAFIGRLVEALRDVMAARLVFFTVADGGQPKRVRFVHAWENGALGDNFAYEVAGTPCERVIEGERVIVPCDRADHFASYGAYGSILGLPIRGRDGSVDGHLALFGEGPIVDTELGMETATLLVQRVEAERQRLVAEEAREDLVVDLEAVTARLRRQYALLPQTNRFKTELLAMIAHDLRNPLSAIQAQAELIAARSENDSPAARSAGKIGSNVKRMAALIAASLPRAREDEAVLETSRREADLGALIALALETNRAAAQDKGIGLLQRAGPGSTGRWTRISS